MEGLNLHAVVGDALSFVNPWKDMIFTKTTVEWQKNSYNRVPEKKTSTFTIKGKLQPASSQDLAEMGFNVKEYQYYRLYLSLDVTQIDTLRQLGADNFVCDGIKYRVVAKEDWMQNGWREAYCYAEGVVND